MIEQSFSTGCQGGKGETSKTQDNILTDRITFLNGQSDKTMCLFTGLQASGKSTFYARHLTDRFAHISLDVLRTRNRERLAIEECLTAGQSFVVDNTNPTRLERLRYFELVQGYGYTVIGCYFRSAIAECLERNAQREGKKRLPDKALAAVSKKLEIPSLDEGFSRLWYVRLQDDRFVVAPWLEDDQENKQENEAQKTP